MLKERLDHAALKMDQLLLAWKGAKESEIVDDGSYRDALDVLLVEVDDAILAARKAAGAERS